MKLLRASPAVALMWFVACSDEEPTDTGFPDATTRDAAPPTDANVPDAGEPDSGQGAALHIRYHRPDRHAGEWMISIDGRAPIAAARSDDFGADFEIPSAGAPSDLTYQFIKGEQSDPASAVTLHLADAPDGVWHFSGRDLPVFHKPPAIPSGDQVAVYYVRKDGSYSGWGLHVWGDVARETQWTAPLMSSGTDTQLGSYFVVDVMPNGDRVNLIVHMGDTKDPGPDMGFEISALGNMVWVLTGSTEIFPFPVEVPALSIDGARAHFLTREYFAWSPAGDPAWVELVHSPIASIEVEDIDVVGGEKITLTEDTGGLPPPVQLANPQLRMLRAFKIDAATDVAALVKEQLILVARDDKGRAVDATHVQIPGALDDLFAYDGPLGLTFDAQSRPTITVWAPTASEVRLHRFDADLAEVEDLPMTVTTSGAWSITGEAAWTGGYYQYELHVYHPLSDRIETVHVTDPYSVLTSINGRHTAIVDLENDPNLRPAGWDALVKPPLDAPEDITLYEVHIRDFSAFDPTVMPEHRGKYAAFSDEGAVMSAGMSHLQELAAAGLTHLHLLPFFDIATVDEDPAARVDLDGGFDRLCVANPLTPAELCDAFGTMPIREVLSSFARDSDRAQEVMIYLRTVDSFNWGYDPVHYTVPEGSYATGNGKERILEVRKMVQALAGIGLRVVMDVVYNHTNASGLLDKSVLDKVVPGYYHRLNVESGIVERSTCCENTATEHYMMERLMIDSLVTWAKQYKIDGFRFDLMGHHMKRNMVKAYERLHALTEAADGVDGSKIYFYGEGWNFGEVANNARGANAVQENMAGTGVGTFNDRLRDGVRGGGPFDNGADLRTHQGFANGLSYDPFDSSSDPVAARAELLLRTDHIRAGMAGNLRRFRIVTARGSTTTANSIAYNGAPTAYVDDPQETINYVSAHDNQTLFDINAYKTPAGTEMDARVRIQNLGLSIVALGQGVPFFHFGDDLLRSKSMERDSYDAGDWFNRVDFSLGSNNWKVGLPSEDKNGANYPQILEVFADASIAPTAAHIERASEHLREVLAVRKSSVLFRLRSGDEVKLRVDYRNVGPTQIPGVIVQTISDGLCAGADLDPANDAVVTIVNATTEGVEVVMPGATGFELHPVFVASGDNVVAGASFSEATATFSVPARTTAVFVEPQQGPQGDGLPCNTL